LQNAPLDSPTHEQIEQALFDLSGPARCVSCGKIVFDKGAKVHGRSI
jgi:hypothetical protein